MRTLTVSPCRDSCLPTRNSWIASAQSYIECLLEPRPPQRDSKPWKRRLPVERYTGHWSPRRTSGARQQVNAGIVPGQVV
jgi:hypothetical protein